MEKFDKIKKHVRDNKQLYTGIGIGVGVGATIACALTGRVNVRQIAVGKNITLEQTTVLARRGHPGNIVKCVETGELFASQNRAAQACKLNAGELSKHLRGLQPDVAGLTFQKLGEAV